MALLFSNLAESGGVSPWEFYSITCEADNTFEPSTEQAYEGSYSYRAYFGGTNNSIIAQERFGDQGIFRAVIRFRINSTMNTNPLIFGINDGTQVICYVSFSYSAPNITTSRFYHYNDAGAAYTSISGTTITRDEWHIFEVFYKRASAAGANDGAAWLKYDGNVLANVTGLDNDTRTPDRIECGNLSAVVPGAGSIVYFEVLGYDTESEGGSSSKVPIIMQTMNQFNGGMV